MFKHAILYRLVCPQPIEAASLEQRAEQNTFTPCGPTQMASVGWEPPRGEEHGALVESIDRQLLLRLTRETRSVPSASIKQEVAKRAKALEDEIGRKPGRKALKLMKEEVAHELMPRAFPKRSSVPVWIDRANMLLVVGAGSVAGADVAASMVIQLLDEGTSVALLKPAQSTEQAMARWLLTQEPPECFDIGRECELRMQGSDGGAVRYSRESLFSNEITGHLNRGKLPTKLALTWEGRVSFVLTDALTLRSVTFLDVTMDNAKGTDSGFDTNAAIATGELSRLIPDLLASVGGEAPPDLVAAAATPSAEGATDERYNEAVSVVLQHERASISLVQRYLQIGYNRAARLLESMEAAGVVSAMDARGNRKLIGGPE